MKPKIARLLTNDGRRVFEYDYENQLTNVYVASACRSEFKYDALRCKETQERNHELISMRRLASPRSGGQPLYVVTAKNDWEIMKTRIPILVSIMVVWLLSLADASAFYDPGLQRWINRDPIGEKGGENLFGFVINDAVNGTDPLGLETAVVIGCGAGKNIFGHVAIATTESGIFSSRTKHDFGSSFTDYMKDQASYRDSIVYILPTTPEQEKKIIEKFKERAKKGHKASSNNCSSMVSCALQEAGIIDRETPFPGLLQTALQEGVKKKEITTAPVPKGGQCPAFLETFNPKASK